MSKVNEMFDKLKTIVPEGLANEKEDKETKVSSSSWNHECQGQGQERFKVKVWSS